MITRIRRVSLLVISLSLILVMTGCERAYVKEVVQVINPDSELSTQEHSQSEFFLDDNFEEAAAAEECAIPNVRIPITSEVTFFAYETLDTQKKLLYSQLYTAMSNCDEYIDVSTLDIDELNFVFNCVMNDHPELFYIDGYQYKKYTVDGKITKLQFFGNYAMDQDQILSCQAEIEKAVYDILTQLPDTNDEYLIAKAVYEWIIQNTEYDLETDNNQNICSVFLSHRSVCQGYAKAFQYLMQKMGMETVLVTGIANGEGHAWNLSKVNGDYYYIDVTWGDASYIYADSSEVQGVPSINYDYLLVTTEELCKTHTLDDTFALPDCAQDKDNYYIRENLFLNEYDEALIEQIFQRAYQNEENYVTIKFSSEELYNAAKHKLMDEQRVFQFVTQIGNRISYTENKQQRTISFWL